MSPENLCLTDLEELGKWKYGVIGDKPSIRIKNLPKGTIQEVSVVLKVESGEHIVFHWDYKKAEFSSKSSSITQRLNPNVKNKFNFILRSVEDVRELKLDFKNTSGKIEVEEIRIFYFPHILDGVSQKVYDQTKYITKFQPHCEKYLSPICDPKNKSILVIGAGYGTEMLWCIKNGAKEVIGIDLIDSNTSAIKIALEQMEIHTDCRYEILKMSVEEIEKIGRKFDIVLSNNVFEHLPDINKAFDACKKMIDPYEGRIAIFTDPLYYSSMGAHLPLTKPWEHLWNSEISIKVSDDYLRKHYYKSTEDYYRDYDSLNYMKFFDFIKSIERNNLVILQLNIIPDRNLGEMRDYLNEINEEESVTNLALEGMSIELMKTDSKLEMYDINEGLGYLEKDNEINKFWDDLINPILERINAKYIIEIGSGHGVNTKNILEYCVKNDAHMAVIDPYPNFSIDKFKNKYKNRFEFYKEFSLSSLPLLKDYDVVLIDGEHNWYTVYNELKIIEKTFKNKQFPLVFLHGVSWPYARRDYYYNPENIPEIYRQPYKKLKRFPSQTSLSKEEGSDRELNISIYENNPKNGVLTAVEDFMDESHLGFSFEVINAFHGLGILVPRNNEIEIMVKKVYKKAKLLDIVEKERNKLSKLYSESKSQNNLQKNQLRQLEQERTKVTHEYLHVQDDNKLLQDQLRLIDEEKRELSEGYLHVQDDNKLLQDQLRLIDEEKRELSEGYLHVQDDNKLLQDQLRLIDEEKRELSEGYLHVQDDNKLLQDQLRQLEQEKTKITHEYLQTQKNNQSLQEQLNQEIKNVEKAENQLETTKDLIKEKERLIESFEKEELYSNELKIQMEILTAKLYEMEYLNNNHRSIVQRLISKFPSLYILFKVHKTGFKNVLINIKGYRSIKRNNLFDLAYYLKNNGDIRLSGADPILHYIYHGFTEGRKPSPSFDGNYYLRTYKNVQNSNLNPLIHYSLYGIKEKRKISKKLEHKNNEQEKTICVKEDANSNLDEDYKIIVKSELFDVDWYVKQYCVKEDPIKHYLILGFKESRNPNPLFDTQWYLKTNPDVAKSDINPLVHFILYGSNKYLDPNPHFSTLNYLKNNPDVATNGMNPLLHYIKHGIEEGRKPFPVVSSEIPTTSPEDQHKKICAKNASMINLYQFKEDTPLVSIIILNRNGIKHLKRLFKGFQENIHYPSYELIVVDNASSDESIQFLNNLKEENLPLKIIRNSENKTFSQANNEAVKVAQGEYILFLNNDVEPTYGWLNQMMQVALRSNDIGAVGATLVYPDCSDSIHNKHNSFKIQHTGIGFKVEDGFIKPYNLGNGDSFNEEVYVEKERVAVTAAALLVKKDKYMEVQGLDERYNYGYEDVDLCLKLHKAGYNNIYCPQALLFHYEFGTQENNKKSEVRGRRLKNRELFIQKWNKWLKKEYLRDKLENNNLFSDNKLKIALVVSEVGDNASAGDYFTALELGEDLKKLGWELSFISRNGPGDWYDVGEDIDILISFLDSYDPLKINGTHGYLIKIAWARNWFSRWAENHSLHGYDLVLASSETACSYMEEKSGIKTLLLPIATNYARFNSDIGFSEEYNCDYCFTGSYWNDPRDIVKMLEPTTVPYDFKLYGKNWDQVDKFKDYYQGFLNYFNLPKLYASTKIVIDDANRVTKDYGAVNSRVYDALASGALVLTNGVIGAQETFNGKLPSFSSKKELNELLNYYLSNDDERLAKVKELQEMVLKDHTYKNRALRLKEILGDFMIKNKIAIKIPAPDWERVQEWGDYHLALSLKKEMERKDCAVKLQVLEEWDEDSYYDVVLVLRGLSKYKPQKQHFNVMWNISHPEKVNLDEYNQYDHVFIASKYWAQKISGLVDVPVDSLLQCTDPELFYSDYSDEYEYDLLFVGNSRKVFRKIIKDLLPTNYDLAVYGKDWEEFIDPKYIKGEFIPNSKLRKAYSSCKILLNDHWDDMREKGFISNRLFDGFACGAFIISDKVKGGDEIFGDGLVTYEDGDELKSLIEYYLDNEDKRMKKVKINEKYFTDQYNCQNRTEKILTIINQHK
ncbi:glycosyltransferase family protein [Methanobacterium ferruginis]|uniref:glycosyltransferase family protein n=1 Tax=Methanobacterium ferruginis TaxID=710191 RepID=UPI0025739FDB|nr:glycosyltransferase [Methanobacterium ferruginis]BDZ69406.1 hypothetical protein GCM10025860_28540 [Methanobacterium ferruginis]